MIPVEDFVLLFFKAIRDTKAKANIVYEDVASSYVALFGQDALKELGKVDVNRLGIISKKVNRTVNSYLFSGSIGFSWNDGVYLTENGERKVQELLAKKEYSDVLYKLKELLLEVSLDGICRIAKDIALKQAGKIYF